MKVKFIPQNIELEISPEKTLLQFATENQIEIKSICKGVPSCAECRVRVVEGENNVLPPNKAELNLIGTNWRIDSRRLACQIRCYGDITVDMTEQLEKQESQTKKVRGFRSQKQTESHAVQDTMLLTEKPEERGDRAERRDASEGSAESPARSEAAEVRNASALAPEPRQQGRQKRGGGGGRRNEQRGGARGEGRGKNQQQRRSDNKKQSQQGPQKQK